MERDGGPASSGEFVDGYVQVTDPWSVVDSASVVLVMRV